MDGIKKDWIKGWSIRVNDEEEREIEVERSKRIKVWKFWEVENMKGIEIEVLRNIKRGGRERNGLEIGILRKKKLIKVEEKEVLGKGRSMVMIKCRGIGIVKKVEKCLWRWGNVKRKKENECNKNLEKNRKIKYDFIGKWL